MFEELKLFVVSVIEVWESPTPVASNFNFCNAMRKHLQVSFHVS